MKLRLKCIFNKKTDVLSNTKYLIFITHLNFHYENIKNNNFLLIFFFYITYKICSENNRKF